MRIALDTNVLAYAEGVGTEKKQTRSFAVLERLRDCSIILPAQTLGELYRVLTGKARRGTEDARAATLGWADAYPAADSTWSAFQSAFDLSVTHGLAIWDALILSVATEQRCRLLLSEDMQDGFTWRGLTIVNPYAGKVHRLLADALEPV